MTSHVPLPRACIPLQLSREHDSHHDVRPPRHAEQRASLPRRRAEALTQPGRTMHLAREESLAPLGSHGGLGASEHLPMRFIAPGRRGLEAPLKTTFFHLSRLVSRHRRLQCVQMHRYLFPMEPRSKARYTGVRQVRVDSASHLFIPMSDYITWPNFGWKGR